MRELTLACLIVATILCAFLWTQYARPAKILPSSYVIEIDYGNAVQGDFGWRCFFRHTDDEGDVREYRVGFIGGRDSAMSRDPEETVILLAVATSEEKLSDPLARYSYLVMPDGGLMPFGGSPVLVWHRPAPPKPIDAERVAAIKKAARHWIEHLNEDPSRESLEMNFDTPPAGWPL